MRTLLLACLAVSIASCSKKNTADGNGGEPANGNAAVRVPAGPLPEASANHVVYDYLKNVAAADLKYTGKAFQIAGYADKPMKESGTYFMQMAPEPLPDLTPDARPTMWNGDKVCVPLFLSIFEPSAVEQLANITGYEKIVMKGVITDHEFRSGSSGLLPRGVRADETLIVRFKVSEIVSITPYKTWVAAQKNQK